MKIIFNLSNFITDATIHYLCKSYVLTHALFTLDHLMEGYSVYAYSGKYALFNLRVYVATFKHVS